MVIAQGVETDPAISGLLSGLRVPLTMQAADLSADYHAVRISTGAAPDPVAGMLPFMMLGVSTTGGAQNLDLQKALALSWTKGDIVLVGAERFLVSYKLDLNPVDFVMRTARVPGQEAEKPAPLPTDLRLALVKLNAIQEIEYAPKMTPDNFRRILGAGRAPTVMDAVGERADETVTVSNMKQVALSLVMYTNDYDDVLPYAQGTHAVQYVTYPYLKNIKAWETRNPNGGEFRFNLAVGGVSMPAFEAPAETPMVYESKAWPDGKRTVGFLDGHVKRVDQEEWKKMQKFLTRWLPASGKPFPLNYGKDWKPAG
ncbi:hypothetical protein OP10G_3998 [Fimbriimonas ginsengisoli Gsoil 348]|uniref:Uncharacterized protein n=1 Tax=Fimbriimonas ginsengisoli Gsoil 348 TaxID=661478 RepID=A0A068NV90_FIMGI|nr:hypothetical protein OP10G_3998 [Fimbriimonas ginsengisoli Gsoil 348]